MTIYTGNAIPAPSYVQSSTTVDSELLYSTVAYTQKGVTLKPGQGVLPLGTLIKQDSTTKMYVKATTGPEGVLRKTVDTGTDAAGPAWQANIVLMGMLQLAPVVSANSGVTLTSVLGGQVNTVRGYFKF